MLLAACAALALGQGPGDERVDPAVLESARTVLQRARDAAEALDLDLARSRGEEALELLLPRLPLAGGGVDEELMGELLTAGRLADRLTELGAFEGARTLLRPLIAGYASAGLDDHPDSYYCRALLAYTENDLRVAASFLEHEVRAREAMLSEDHPDLVRARANLALLLWSLGDLEAARTLQESVLATRENTLAEGHPDLALPRAHLALTLWSLGDREAARALQESVLSSYEKTLPEDHPDLALARANLAITLADLGDLDAARALQESVLTAFERTLPEDHPELVRARSNLALTLSSLGELAAARALLVSVLKVRERTHSEDHHDIALARSNLAITLADLGDLEAARALHESVLATRERTLSEGHPDLAQTRDNLAETLLRSGDLQAARDLLPELTTSLLARLEGLVAASPREARTIARNAGIRLSTVLLLSDSGATSGDRRAWAFDLVESLRHVSQATPVDAAATSDAGLGGWRREAARLRAELNDLVAGGESRHLTESISTEVARLVAERDRLERRIRGRLASQGHFTESIRAEALAKTVESGAAAVGFLRYGRERLDPETRTLSTTSSLLAHVVLRGERPVRIELGPLAELEPLARAWRAAMGKPTERGMAVVTDDERAAGKRLRRRVLDPVLEAAGDARTLHVCLDDLLYLVPLDALPLGEGCVGDRYQIVNEVSFARLIAPRRAPESAPSLLALGGASFDVEPEDGARRIPPLVSESRGRPGERFTPLLQTRFEVETIGALFEETFDEEATLLTKKGATKSALHRLAVGARYVHLATHGWFAPETVLSQADDRPTGGLWRRAGTEEAVAGLAPMTLCGLALTGANTGRDSLGRVPGILTAEELAAIDLSQCELAVLSACETNVGIRRAGQGIQSLQSALHAAGARTSVTSLWRVDDAMTRRLMELFYTNLWVEKMPKADALWAAKAALRGEGAPVKDWGGWLLTGDPN